MNQPCKIEGCKKSAVRDAMCYRHFGFVRVTKIKAFEKADYCVGFKCTGKREKPTKYCKTCKDSYGRTEGTNVIQRY